MWGVCIVITIITMLASACDNVDEDFYEEHLENFEDLESTFEWTFQMDDNNKPSPVLIVTWELSQDLQFDGWMYSIKNPKTEEYLNPNDHTLAGERIGNGEMNCSGFSLSLAEKHESLTPEEARGAEYCSYDCFDEISSDYWQENYTLISKFNRSIKVTKNLEFGQDYLFTLFAAWKFVRSEEAIFDETAGFCVDSIMRDGRTKLEEARKACNGSSTGKFVSGPIFNFTAKDFTYNFSSNTALAIISWQNPLDVNQSVKFGKFCILRQGSRWKEYKAYSDRGKESYNFQIPGVPNETYCLYIIATTQQQKCDYSLWSDHFIHAEKLKIPDVDACKAVNDSSYCSENSNCVDNQWDQDKNPAECKCYVGFKGNGTNPQWGGNGCKTTCSNQNSLINHTCTESAECTETDVGVSCVCPSGTFGDGMRQGSGCTSIFAVILPIATILLISIVVVVLVLHRRSRRRREWNEGQFISSSAHEHPMKIIPLTIEEEVFFANVEVDENNIKLLDIVGRGAFASVYKAIFRKDSTAGECEVAVKVPNENRPESEFLSEVALLVSIGNHDNIVSVIGCCTKNAPKLITEFMKYGDLLHFLWDAREPEKRNAEEIYKLTEGSIYKIGNQVACGMTHLSKLRIIHGDIAARNILVGEDLLIKISDFGLANDVYRYGVIQGRMEKKVPFKWISPERMMAGRVPISWRSDVWSFGILLYEAITLGEEPFVGVSQSELLEKLRSGYRMARPVICTEYLYKILCRCWEWVPSNRPSFKDLQNLLVPQENGQPCIELHGVSADQIV